MRATNDQPAKTNPSFPSDDGAGVAAAEDDKDFLSEYFIDTGNLAALLELGNNKHILIGGAGAGKTALLAMLSKRRRHVIPLSPQSLSLQLFARSSVVRFLEAAGANLTILYAFMWKHLLIVELLRAKCDIRDDDNYRTCMSKIRETLYRHNRVKEQLVEYSAIWGDFIWLGSDGWVREFASRIENVLKRALTGMAMNSTLSLEEEQLLTAEQKSRVSECAKSVVNELQSRDLDALIQSLGDAVFIDSDQEYFLSVDRLDEDWVDSPIKARMTKALLDAAQTISRFKSVKVIVALRPALFDRVRLSAADSDFHADNYGASCLYLHWDKKSLAQLIQSRANCLIGGRCGVVLSAILPETIDGQPAIDYILQHTLLRPRDVVLFINECIVRAEGRRLGTAAIREAEEAYSLRQLDSLTNEWRMVFPNLSAVAEMFRGVPAKIPLNALSKEFLSASFRRVSAAIQPEVKDPNVDLLNSLDMPSQNFGSMRSSLVRNLFGIGMLGIKPNAASPVRWVTDSQRGAVSGDIRPSAILYIHPMFHRGLGCKS